MSNSTRRGRRRPRRRSVNFRSFYWLLERVATFEVMRSSLWARETESFLRRELARANRTQVNVWFLRCWPIYQRLEVERERDARP